jgi:hypothetical protein
MAVMALLIVFTLLSILIVQCSAQAYCLTVFEHFTIDHKNWYVRTPICHDYNSKGLFCKISMSSYKGSYIPYIQPSTAGCLSCGSDYSTLPWYQTSSLQYNITGSANCNFAIYGVDGGTSFNNCEFDVYWIQCTQQPIPVAHSCSSISLNTVMAANCCNGHECNKNPLPSVSSC